MDATIPPPHPNPHAPHRFTPPPGACDAHCHIFGPGDTFPYAADRAYTPPDSGIDDFERLQQRLGLSRAVFVQASCHGTDNAAMVDALHRGQGRYAGVAMIDESFSDADIAELHDAGVRGTRFNFVAHLGGAPELGEFWRIVHRVVPFGWHIVLALRRQGPLPVRIAARRHAVRVRHRPHGEGRRRGGRRAGAVPPTARADGRRALLGEDLGRRAAHGRRNTAVRRRRAVRAGAHRRRARPRVVGHRLAAPERPPHGRRRRSRRRPRRLRARRGDPQPHPRRQPDRAVRVRLYDFS